MTWEDDSTTTDLTPAPRREPGRTRSLRRTLGEGEDPLTWSIPLFRVRGVRVRIHVLFLAVLLFQLIFSIPQDRIGPQHVAMAALGLFLASLGHELGRVAACRAAAGEVHHIVLWPLGGLTAMPTPYGWRGAMTTTLMGLIVNALAWPVLMAMLWIARVDWSAMLFDPRRIDVALGMIRSPLVAVLWWLYVANAAVLLFNLLLPMFPLAAGRLVQAFLWRRGTLEGSTQSAARLGMGVSAVLLLAAMTGESTRLMALAICCGGACYIQDRKARFVRTPAPALPSEAPTRTMEPPPPSEDQAEVDRVLEKISISGMASLSRGERDLLQRATERRRRRELPQTGGESS